MTTNPGDEDRDEARASSVPSAEPRPECSYCPEESVGPPCSECRAFVCEEHRPEETRLCKACAWHAEKEKWRELNGLSDDEPFDEPFENPSDEDRDEARASAGSSSSSLTDEERAFWEEAGYACACIGRESHAHWQSPTAHLHETPRLGSLEAGPSETALSGLESRHVMSPGTTPWERLSSSDQLRLRADAVDAWRRGWQTHGVSGTWVIDTTNDGRWGQTATGYEARDCAERLRDMLCRRFPELAVSLRLGGVHHYQGGVSREAREVVLAWLECHWEECLDFEPRTNPGDEDRDEARASSHAPRVPWKLGDVVQCIRRRVQSDTGYAVVVGDLCTVVPCAGLKVCRVVAGPHDEHDDEFPWAYGNSGFIQWARDVFEFEFREASPIEEQPDVAAAVAHVEGFGFTVEIRDVVMRLRIDSAKKNVGQTVAWTDFAPSLESAFVRFAEPDPAELPLVRFVEETSCGNRGRAVRPWEDLSAAGVISVVAHKGDTGILFQNDSDAVGVRLADGTEVYWSALDGRPDDAWFSIKLDVRRQNPGDEDRDEARAGAGRPGVSGLLLPTLKKRAVWHVGPRTAVGPLPHVSYEGLGLSVSEYPEVWARIARTGPETWKLTPSAPRRAGLFLDVRQVPKTIRAQLTEVAVVEGLLAQTTRWKVSWVDDVDGIERHTLHESLFEADREAANFEDDDGLPTVAPESVEVWAATPTLQAMWSQKYSGPLGPELAEEVAWQVILERDRPDLDGFWWDEELIPESFSVPRGMIFYRRVPSWEWTPGGRRRRNPGDEDRDEARAGSGKSGVDLRSLRPGDVVEALDTTSKPVSGTALLARQRAVVCHKPQPVAVTAGPRRPADPEFPWTFTKREFVRWGNRYFRGLELENAGFDRTLAVAAGHGFAVSVTDTEHFFEMLIGIGMQHHRWNLDADDLRLSLSLVERPGPGTRVVLVSDVDRYPHFRAGAWIYGGEVTSVEVQDDDDEITCHVKLDHPLTGAEEWNNEIHWGEGSGGPEAPWYEEARPVSALGSSVIPFAGKSTCRWCRQAIVDQRLESGAEEPDWATIGRHGGDYGCDGSPDTSTDPDDPDGGTGSHAPNDRCAKCGIKRPLRAMDERSVCRACRAKPPSENPRGRRPRHERSARRRRVRNPGDEDRDEARASGTDGRERFRSLLAERAALVGYDELELAHKAAMSEINERGNRLLKELDPRIRRSKRSRFGDLLEWAKTVVGDEQVELTVGHLAAEREAVVEQSKVAVADRQRLQEELDLKAHKVAWVAEPKRGSLEVEYEFCSVYTHSSSGSMADLTARKAAEARAVFLASQGFTSRVEAQPGRRAPDPYQSAGWRVFVSVSEPLDAEILRLREAGWTYPSSRYFGLNGAATPRELDREWGRERWNMLGWDPDPRRPGDCCPMTVERMHQIVAERGPLRPSWLGWTPPQANPGDEDRDEARASAGSGKAACRGEIQGSIGASTEIEIDDRYYVYAEVKNDGNHRAEGPYVEADLILRSPPEGDTHDTIVDSAGLMIPFSDDGDRELVFDLGTLSGSFKVKVVITVDDYPDLPDLGDYGDDEEDDGEDSPLDNPGDEDRDEARASAARHELPRGLIHPSPGSAAIIKIDAKHWVQVSVNQHVGLTMKLTGCDVEASLICTCGGPMIRVGTQIAELGLPEYSFSFSHLGRPVEVEVGLSAALNPGDEDRDEARTSSLTTGVLGQIRVLASSGLLTSQVRRAIKGEVSPVFTDSDVVAAARRAHHIDGEIEVDPRAEIRVSSANLHGCYVQAWAWVDLEEEQFLRLVRKGNDDFSHVAAEAAEVIIRDLRATKDSLGRETRREIMAAVSPVFTDQAVEAEARLVHDAVISEGAELSVADEPDLNGCYVEVWVWVDLGPKAAQRLQRAAINPGDEDRDEARASSASRPKRVVRARLDTYDAGVLGGRGRPTCCARFDVASWLASASDADLRKLQSHGTWMTTEHATALEILRAAPDDTLQVRGRDVEVALSMASSCELRVSLRDVARWIRMFRPDLGMPAPRSRPPRS